MLASIFSAERFLSFSKGLLLALRLKNSQNFSSVLVASVVVEQAFM